MKKIYVLLLIAATFFACQSEDSSVTQELDSALTKSAPLTRLVSRVSQNPTHCDNILDDSNCYSIKLPVTLTVNGQTITVNNENDFDTVENIIQASGSDDDIIHLAFPITVVFPDFHQATISNQSELNAIQCSDDDFNEIRCIDFVFPIVINTYNTNNQIANTVTIPNNYELFQFVQEISETQIFTVVYPVSLTLGNAQTVTANSNNELEDLIEDAIDDCDNDNGPVPAPLELHDIIASGIWHISFCEGGGPGGPDNYQNYNFTFNSNGTITVSRNGVISYGTWDLYQDGSHQKIDLNFTDPMLNNLEEDWKVTEYNQTNFRLKKDSDSGGHGHGGGNNYVYFTKN